MGKNEEREGKSIYREGVVEVRTHPNDIYAHNVWVDDEYFLLQRGVLEQFAEKTQSRLLRTGMDILHFNLVNTLKQYQITPEEFVLILARARIKELDTQLSDAHREINSLSDRIQEK